MYGMFMYMNGLCIMYGILYMMAISMAMTQDWRYVYRIPYLYKAFFLGLCKGIDSQNMALDGRVYIYLHLGFLNWPFI